MQKRVISKLRGYSGHDSNFKTTTHERGLFGYPLNLQEVRGDPATEVDYFQWFERLAQAGVNLLRIRLTGRQQVWGTDRRACGFEPPPAGTFNPWLVVLDPDRRADYRRQQFALEMTDAQKEGSNLAHLVAAANEHGIKFSMVPFDNVEFGRNQAWGYHAWNRNNQYITGAPCDTEDRGFVVNPHEVFSNDQCKDAAKRRIDAIIQAFEGTEVIACWELMEEMTWLATAEEFWGLNTWDDRMRANVRGILVPWVNEMAAHIKANHSAPVGNAHGFMGGLEFRPDPNFQMNVINEIHQAEELDLVFINWYKGEDPSIPLTWLRNCQEHFDEKQVVVSQYAPWLIQRPSAGYQGESAPYPQSKRLEWTHTCGVPGFVGPQRWLGIREQTKNIWLEGGLADPGLRDIAGVTSECASLIDFDRWEGVGKAHEEQINSPGHSHISAWGDGQHVTMYLEWPTGGNKTVTVDGLRNQDYEVHFFDWITGGLIHRQEATASGGTLVLNGVPTHHELVAAVAAYISPLEEPEPEQPEQPVTQATITLSFRDTTTPTAAPTQIELLANHSYILDVTTSEE